MRTVAKVWDSRTVTIEKGIPIPDPGANHLKYPWTTMEIGDSFIARPQKRSSLSSVLRRYGPKRFITRKVNEDGVDKIRVWRIE